MAQLQPVNHENHFQCFHPLKPLLSVEEQTSQTLLSFAFHSTGRQEFGNVTPHLESSQEMGSDGSDTELDDDEEEARPFIKDIESYLLDSDIQLDLSKRYHDLDSPREKYIHLLALKYAYTRIVNGTTSRRPPRAKLDPQTPIATSFLEEMDQEPLFDQPFKKWSFAEWKHAAVLTDTVYRRCSQKKRKHYHGGATNSISCSSEEEEFNQSNKKRRTTMDISLATHQSFSKSTTTTAFHCPSAAATTKANKGHIHKHSMEEERIVRDWLKEFARTGPPQVISALVALCKACVLKPARQDSPLRSLAHNGTSRPK